MRAHGRRKSKQICMVMKLDAKNIFTESLVTRMLTRDLSKVD